MALFPFVIVVTSLAATFFGSTELADEVAPLLLETWPREVAGPIASEIHNVLTRTRGDILTIGVALAIYFASSGIESLRIGLNRAYGVIETRNWLLLRMESILYVLVGAVALLALAFLIVLGPLMFATAASTRPALFALEWNFTRRALRHGERCPDHRAGDRAQMAAGRTAALPRDRGGHRRHARPVARERHRVRPLPRGVCPTSTSPTTPASRR